MGSEFSREIFRGHGQPQEENGTGNVFCELSSVYLRPCTDEGATENVLKRFVIKTVLVFLCSQAASFGHIKPVKSTQALFLCSFLSDKIESFLHSSLE